MQIDHPAQTFSEAGILDESSVLLAVPHSGRFYPAELLGNARLPVDQLRRLEDPFVDMLIANATAKGIGAIVGIYARAWIDLNRRETELDPRQISPSPPSHVDHRSPRVAAGLGLIPQAAGNGRMIYDRPLPFEAIRQRIRDVHQPYHARITARLNAIKARHGLALLCDMHSMPSLPAAQAADIVIGDRHGRTASPWLVDAVAGWLTQHGCRVTRNLPYAGGYGVEQHGQPANAIHAIQIEIDRRLYLEADGMTLSRNAETVTELIAGLTVMLREMLESGPAHRLAAE